MCMGRVDGVIFKHQLCLEEIFMKRLLMKCGPMLASLALFFTTIAENSVCFVYAYQPEIPEEAKRLSKYNCD